MLTSSRRARLAWAAFTAALLGCAHSTSSRGAGPVPAWRATLAETDGTTLDIRVTIRQTEPGRWELFSRSGAVLEMTSWRQRWLGRLFGKLPPHNAILYVKDGTSEQSGDSLLVRGRLESPMLGTKFLAGSMRGGRFEAVLRWNSDSGTIAGTLNAVPDASPAPYRDYRRIAQTLVDTLRAVIFDPRLAARDPIAGRLEEFTRAAARAHDDLDIVAAFNSRAQKFGVTHFGLIRNPRIAQTPIDSLAKGDPLINPATLVQTSFYGPDIFYLRVQRWERVTPLIERAFARMAAARAKVLIMDIRGNPGGDASSLSPAMYLLPDTIQLGAFVGRLWFDQHSKPPTLQDYTGMPVLTTATPPIELFHALHSRGAIVVSALPKTRQFTGTVFVLIDGRAGSASEPIAHLLRATGRATLVGERTAGAMLMALPHPVGDDFIVRVPEGDFYFADGARLEGNGVRPHIEVASRDATVRLIPDLRAAHPYSGAIWAASVFTGFRRYDEAERAWLDARALAPNDSLRRWIDGRITAVKTARAESLPAGR